MAWLLERWPLSLALTFVMIIAIVGFLTQKLAPWHTWPLIAFGWGMGMLHNLKLLPDYGQG